jgi:hypothetical protein
MKADVQSAQIRFSMRILILPLLLLFCSEPLFAQHVHPGSDSMNRTMPAESTAPDSMHAMHMDHGSGRMPSMSHSFSRNLPMTRNGSGTAWLPDAAPMYGQMLHSGNWMFMLHYNLWLRYNNQDFTRQGTRGGDAVDAPNWAMFMGQRTVGKKGLFHFSTMLSLDALTVGNAGYPLLFQSGEAYQGNPLVDRQHPHDLFSELSVSYAHTVSKKTDVFLYLGYPGEPALGPVAFMHRPSALYNPDAPLSHHWIDATHITSGVATLGVRIGQLKLEGSSFTGREPDEHRYDFDQPLFNSWSSRLSYNPSRNWALQVSHGFLKSPEALHPDEDIHRTTASATYSLPLTRDRVFNAIALWGLNKTQGHNGEHAALLEASWRNRNWAIYGRYEYVQKSVEELALDATTYGHDALFPVHAATLGTSYDLLRMRNLRLAAGGQFSLYQADHRLDPLYGSHPMAYQFYLRLYPSRMMM